MSSDKAKIYNPGAEVVLFCVGIILVMFKSNRILYVRYLPDLLIYGFGMMSFIFYALLNRKSLEKLTLFSFVSVALVVAIYIFEVLQVAIISIPSLLCYMTTLTGAVLLIQSNIEVKWWVLRQFSNVTAVIVGIAVVGWIMFLVGIPLPHYYDNSDVFYEHTVYYIFNLIGTPEEQLIPRFAGPFLEPGHLGTMCIFLLYINEFRLKKLSNIIFLTAAILSLSLAAYGLLVGAVIIMLFIKRRYVWMTVMAVLFVFIGIAAEIYRNGQNPLYEVVVSRLEQNEDGTFVGDNRTSKFFDMAYYKYLQTNKVWLGVGRAAYGKRGDGSDTVTMGTAGFKRYFYLRGIVGMALICCFLLYYTSHYGNKKVWGFLVVYIVANLIRDYPTKEIWMYLYLMSAPVMYYGDSLNRRLLAPTKRKKKGKLRN